MTIDLILQNPNLLPRDEVRIERVTASSYPDRRRIRVEVELTPFRERPNLDLAVLDQGGQPVTGSSVVGIMGFKTAFTLHLRHLDDPSGDYTIRVQLYYDDPGAPQDVATTPLSIPPGASDTST